MLGACPAAPAIIWTALGIARLHDGVLVSPEKFPTARGFSQEAVRLQIFCLQTAARLLHSWNGSTTHGEGR